MSTQDPLSREARRFIVLIALAQGLLLWLAEIGTEHRWWPFSELGGRVCWYTLVLGVPGVMALSVRRLDDRRFWQHVALVTALLAALLSWAAWSATGAPGLQSGEVLGPYGFTTALALFVALPWLQCRLQYGRWCAPYADLFEYAWQNALTLALTLLFVGICWGVLTLWAALFALVKIDFFQDLFREHAFVYLATGGMAGLGVLIGRTQQRPIRVARQIVLAIFTGLLPLLAFIALLFALSLLSTGLEPLWNTRSATAILMSLVGLIIVFTNAVYQDGLRAPPYPAWLRRLIDAGLLVLPVHAAIGLYALYLRIDQYGWTADRYWAALVCVILSAYALGYAAAVLRRRVDWLAPIRRVNVALSLVVIALIAASNSPLLDPHRLGVNDQVARWTDGRTDAKHLDLEHLRFDSGRRGYRAAQALRADARVQADTALAAELAKVLERPQRHAWRDAEERRRAAVTQVEQFAATLQPATGSPAPDAAFLQALLASDAAKTECRQSDDDCVYLARDFDGDGSIDALLCGLGDAGLVRCQLWDRSDGSWRVAARFDWYGDTATELKRALRAGEVTPAPRRWPDLKAGDHLAVPTTE
ncbi:MAG: DUF4153 domain-containing protein [Rhodanobacteraceae bacterium]|jgi:hypothetical protein|nr:DUF4153 domain-containing protein [Rhodanobacteraceae bacterium]